MTTLAAVLDLMDTLERADQLTLALLGNLAPETATAAGRFAIAASIFCNSLLADYEPKEVLDARLTGCTCQAADRLL